MTRLDNQTAHSIPVTRSSMPPLEEFINEIAPLWESRWLTNRGELHRQLEIALAEYLGSPNLALFANGHLALESLIEVFELQGEVITTPFTFASTTHALVRQGITPVFADIRADNYTIDPAAIESLITPRTSAILPVHVYGALCDVDAIQSIADAHGLTVIYDAAHAFGVARDGKGAAAFGDASMFSFHATKVFHTIEGGAAIARSPEIAERLYRLQNFGLDGPESIVSVGGNAKMNEFAAAMGLCNLRRVDGEIESRGRAYETYAVGLAEIDGVYLPPITGDWRANYSYMPIQIDPERFGATRDQVVDALAEAGITARKYFSPLTSQFAAYGDRYSAGSTPIAQKVSETILALPMYAGLQESDVERVCGVIREAGEVLR